MLKPIRIHKIGNEKLEFYKCDKCNTEYPIIDNSIKCNGHIIMDCPWCAENSKPWTKGRGI